jgi:hypothetical protein
MYEIEGADQLAALAKRLREVGDKDLQRKLYAGINRAMKPLRAQAKTSLQQHTPKRRGLAARKAKTVKFRVSRRTGQRTAGVRLTAQGGQVGAMDRGEIWHPIFGRANTRVRQPMPPGWFTTPTRAAGPEIRSEVEAVMSDVARQIGGGR